MHLIVNEDWHTFTTSFYLRERRGNHTIIIGQKDGLLVEQTIDGTVAPAPVEAILKMPSPFAQQFLKAVQDYNSNNNLKTENENLLQGKLQATERHLQDLQKYFQLGLDVTLQSLKR